MLKVIEKLEEESEGARLNYYSPNNIYITSFNPRQLDKIAIKFGAPIASRKNRNDGIYMAPEVLQGEPASTKSVVFTMGVIWDELIHGEPFFKSAEEIENMGYEFKIRDSKLNPILKNTLFEMLVKDDGKRLELAETKRRLSLQKYISAENKPHSTRSHLLRKEA